MNYEVKEYEIIEQARRFKDATHLIWEKGSSNLAIPAEVMASFTCELFFKYLYFVSYAKISRIHELDKLFNKLQQETQNRIISGMKCADNFHDNIKIVGDNFKKWRYEYERFNNLTASFGFLNELMQNLSNICEEDYKTRSKVK